jgi:glc operon protein GlcG
MRSFALFASHFVSLGSKFDTHGRGEAHATLRRDTSDRRRERYVLLFIERRLRGPPERSSLGVMRLPAFSMLLIASSTGAQSGPGFDARAAQAIVGGCAAHAAAKHQSEAIAVVDTGGHLVAALRMDGNGSGIMDFAVAKAQAVAAWGFSTSQMAEAAKSTPGFGIAPHVVTVPGGVPVWSADGRARLGAVGVSGEAPQDDEECAKAGISAAGMRDKHL